MFANAQHQATQIDVVPFHADFHQTVPMLITCYDEVLRQPRRRVTEQGTFHYDYPPRVNPMADRWHRAGQRLGVLKIAALFAFILVSLVMSTEFFTVVTPICNISRTIATVMEQMRHYAGPVLQNTLALRNITMHFLPNSQSPFRRFRFVVIGRRLHTPETHRRRLHSQNTEYRSLRRSSS